MIKIPGKVNGHPVDIIIDTGSDLSIINAFLINQINLAFSSTCLNNPTTANGTLIEIIGSTTITITFGEGKDQVGINTGISVALKVNFQILLGMDVLGELQNFKIEQTCREFLYRT